LSEVRYLDLADYLLIAEAVLDTPAEELALVIRVDLAESALASPAAEFGGVEFYPDFAVKVAVLCRHLIKNHALPDGNKRVGLLCESSSPSGTATSGHLRQATSLKDSRRCV
jgi:death-on-curing protein